MRSLGTIWIKEVVDLKIPAPDLAKFQVCSAIHFSSSRSETRLRRINLKAASVRCSSVFLETKILNLMV